MKCEECQTLMEEYADGVLDEKAGGLVNSHMAGCEDCSKFFAEIGREQEIYARYQRDVEVTPVLWSSIESRIREERAAQHAGFLSRLGERFAGLFAAPRLSPGFAAALVVIAIGITVGVMTYVNSRGSGSGVAVNNPPSTQHPDGEDKAPAPPVNLDKGAQIASNTANGVKDGGPSVSRGRPSTAPKKQTPDQLVREAEQKYLAAIALLSRDVNRHRSQLDPIMLARFDAALGDIDRTIGETRRVVRENPGDPIALQYLLAAYSKKVDVLREMTLTEN